MKKLNKNALCFFGGFISLGFLSFFYVFLVACDYDAPPHFPNKTTPKEAKVKKDISFCDKASAENSCEKSSSCKKDCDKIFSEKQNEKKCQALTTDTVEAFKTLTKQIKDKDEIQEIKAKTLGCFLQIDPEEFADLVKTASRQAVRNFLVAIAESNSLAEAIENKESDFEVLEELFQKAVGGKNLHRVLTKSIEDGKTFLQLSAEEERNQQAFYWLDNYVDFRCEEEEDPLCGDEKEAIVAYCEALTKLSNSDLDDFLDNAEHFEEEYSGEVKDGGADYDEDGFRDFCADGEGGNGGSNGGGNGGGNSNGGGNTGGSNTGGSTTSTTGSTGGGTPCQASTSSACPSSPPAECKLADVTFAGFSVGGQADVRYAKSGGFTWASGTTIPAHGTISPSTNKIGVIFVRVGQTATRIYLSSSEISTLTTASNSWYLYIDRTRYGLIAQSPIGGQLSNVHIFGFTKSLTATTYAIHLAYQDSSSNCHWIRP